MLLYLIDIFANLHMHLDDAFIHICAYWDEVFRGPHFVLVAIN